MIPYPTFAKLSLTFGLALLLAAIGMRSQRDAARTELANYRAQVATATAQAEAANRATEQSMVKSVERLTHAHAKTEQTLVLRADDAGRAAERLRGTIATLNARETPASPELAALTVEARTARDLLGACTEEYRSVAADTDQLSNQVTGLQAYAGATTAHGD